MSSPESSHALVPASRSLGYSHQGSNEAERALADHERDLLDRGVSFELLDEGVERLRTDVFDDEDDEAFQPPDHEDESDPEQSLTRPDGGTRKTWRVVTPEDGRKISVNSFTRHFRLDRSRDEMLSSALHLTHTKRTLDWVEHALPFEDRDTVKLVHDIDFICVIGRTFKPLVVEDEYALTFSTVSFSIGLYWREYDVKRRLRLPFSLNKRCFYLGASNLRMHWYLVMVPNRIDTALNLRARGSSAMSPDRARELAAFMTTLFQGAELSGVGISREWELGDKESYSLNCGQWAKFQSLLMAQWRETLSVAGSDPFWHDHRPTFHVIDFGQKLEITSRGADENALAERLDNLFSSQFSLRNVSTVKYALGTVMRVTREIEGEDVDLAIVSNRESIEDMYSPEGTSRRAFTFYPLALSPRAGNWQSPYQPPFLEEELWGPMAEDLIELHNGLKVISTESFQGYWEAKQQFRPSENSFTAKKCMYTGGLCIGTRGQTATTIKKIRKFRASLSEDSTRRPVEREVERVVTAVTSKRIGFRVEPVVSLDVTLLPEENKSWRHIVTNILIPQMTFWDHYADEFIESHLLLFHPDVFPAVLLSQGLWALSLLGDLTTEMRATPAAGLKAASSEMCSVVERIIVHAFTGDPRVLVASLFRPLGLQNAVQTGGWVWIDKQFLNFETRYLNRSHWPRNAKGLPILSHLAAVRYHHGEAAYQARWMGLNFAEFVNPGILSGADLNKVTLDIIRDIFIPEMSRWVGRQLEREISMNRGRFARVSEAATEDEVENFEVLQESRLMELEEWIASRYPFKKATFSELLTLICPVTVVMNGVLRETFPEANPKTVLNTVYAAEVYNALTSPSDQSMRRIAPANSGWAAALKATIMTAERSSTIPIIERNGAAWVKRITESLDINQIEALPASEGGRLSAKYLVSVIKVWSGGQGETRICWRPQPTAVGIPQNMPAPAPPQRQKMSIGTDIEVTEIPNFVLEGFEEMFKVCRTDRRRNDWIPHLEQMRDCLNPDRKEIKLAVITVSIMRLCTPRPRYAEMNPPSDEQRGTWEMINGYGGSSPIWEGVMILRMLWTLYPNLARNRPAGLQEAFGQCLISYRMLVEVGWCRLKVGPDGQPAAKKQRAARIYSAPQFFYRLASLECMPREHLVARWDIWLQGLRAGHIMIIAGDVFRGEGKRHVLSTIKYVAESLGEVGM